MCCKLLFWLYHLKYVIHVPHLNAYEYHSFYLFTFKRHVHEEHSRVFDYMKWISSLSTNTDTTKLSRKLLTLANTTLDWIWIS